MVFTVPKAGISAGRAAEPVVDTSNAGAAISNFGRTLRGVGERIETDRLDRETRRLQVDMTRDLGQLRLEFEKINDPDEIDRLWPERVQALRNSYLDGVGENGRPRVDPKNHERFGLAFDELSNRHGFAIGQKSIAARSSEAEATWLQYAHEAVLSGSNADTGTREALINQGRQHLNSLYQSGIIDAEEFARRDLALQGDIANGAAIKQINDDPVLFLQMAKAGEFDGLGGETLASYRGQAERAIAANNKAAEVAADKAAKAREKEIGDRLGEIISIADEGFTAVDEKWLNSEEVQNHEKYPEAMAAISLRDEHPNLLQMTPAQLKELGEAEAKRPIKHSWEAERPKLIQKALEAGIEGWEKDPIAYAASVGFDVPELSEYSSEDPQAFINALGERRAFGHELAEAGYTDQPIVFSDADRKLLKEAASVAKTPEERTAFATAIAFGLGENAGGIATNFSGDPAFVHAVELVNQGAPQSTIEAMMSGQKKIADKVVVMPPHNEFAEDFHNRTNGEFRDQPILAPKLLASVKALYAEEWEGDDAGEYDSRAFDRALQRALGGRPDAEGNFTIGGMADMGDYNLILPTGMRHANVELALKDVRKELSPQRRYVDPKQKHGPGEQYWTKPDLSRFKEASLNGELPDFGDPEAEGYDPEDIFDDLQIAPVMVDGKPSDQYVFYRVINGRNVVLKDTAGQAYRFSLQKFVQGGSK